MAKLTSTAPLPLSPAAAAPADRSAATDTFRWHDARAHQQADWHCFDAPLQNDGYRWWYVDALSEDGRSGLTLIAMLGSVFSPYYAGARRRGPTDPLNHTALNVALYGPPAPRWALTERGREAVERTPSRLAFANSGLEWDGDCLRVRIDERTAPLGRRVRGEVRITPRVITDTLIELSPAGNHCWWPIAPYCDVELRIDEPQVRWTGTGYLDSNFGDAPLEQHFRRWDWCRAATGVDEACVQYNVERRDGSRPVLAAQVRADGDVRPLPVLPTAEARRGIWGVQRSTRADAGTRPLVRDVLEDTPFYTRSVLDTHLYGQRLEAVHESLDLDRFSARWVQTLIPFRNPRRA
ncbi:MAG: carotenoid 1,2-hydratase [Pseudomonadota bacterium]